MDMKDSEMNIAGAVATSSVVSEEDSDQTIAEDDATATAVCDPAEDQVHELDKLAMEGGSDGNVDELAKYMEREAHDWHNRVRRAVLGLLSKIPKVGGAISLLVGLFWPANKVDIWEALNLEAYVRNIVRKEIFDFEMRQHRSDIEALERTILRYHRGSLPEKAIALGIWIAQADALSIRLGNSSNRIHLLLHIVTVAVLHMAALHERLTFGEELYGTNNTANWTKELQEQFQTYTSDRVPLIFKEWSPWRESQIEIRAWRRRATGTVIFNPAASFATVEDKISGQMINFSVNFEYSTTIFLDICEAHKTRMMNEAVADMASCMSPTFAFHKLLPDHIQTKYPPYDRQLFGRVFRGPYSQDLLQPGFRSLKTFRLHPTRFDQTARDRILEVAVRAGSLLEAIQFVYDHVNPNLTTPGIMAGNSRGGSRFDVDVRARRIQDLRLEFSRDVLVSLQIRFEDGTSTQRFGNVTGWASNTKTCTAPSGYRLSSWAFREDTGPNNTTTISVVRFQFTPDEPSPY